MGLAFWRSTKRAGNAAAKTPTRPQVSPDDDIDPAAGLRARARHRLVGAAALLLAVAIIVPMVLDPEPKPVSENIPIDIPSERTPFTPRLSLPPVPAADAGTPPPDQPAAPVKSGAPTKSDARAEPKAEAAPDARPEPAPTPKAEAKSEETKATGAEATVGDASKARPSAAPAPAAPAPAATAKGGKFAVQAAAPASEKAARDLVDRLKKGGFATYTEKVETKDGTRYRVRVGPYATREEADKARARLKSLGVNGNLVTL
jgi:DedD protein